MYDASVTLRWLFLALIVLALPLSAAVPACATAAEPAAQAQHEAGQHQTPRRQGEKAKPSSGTCIGCVAPSTVTPPMIEAPNRALMMIPAAWRKIAVALPSRGPTPPPPKQG